MTRLAGGLAGFGVRAYRLVCISKWFGAAARAYRLACLGEGWVEISVFSALSCIIEFLVSSHHSPLPSLWYNHRCHTTCTG